MIDRKLEGVVDGFVVELEGECVGLEPGAVALGAGHIQVAEELHLDLFVAVAHAALAAALTGVEGEEPGREALRLAVVRFREKLPDEVEGTDVNSGRGARRAGERRLIDEDDLTEFFVAGDGPEASRLVFADFASHALKVPEEYFVHEGAFPGSRNTGHAAEDIEGKIDVEVLEVVLLGASQGELTRLLRFSTRGGRLDCFASGEVIGG